jgi:hypothetical protein
MAGGRGMTDPRQPRCDRTPRLVDRVIDDKVTPDDRAHADTCASCGPLLMRATRFDDELRRSARGLVTEQLPHGVLDPALAPPHLGGVLPLRHAAPGLASILAAVVVLVIATSVAVAPGVLGPGTQPPNSGLQVSAPTFRATVDVIRDLQSLGYSCIPGHALPTAGPSAWPGEREGVVCLTPKSIESASAKFIPVETGDGDVVEVTIKGALYGTDTETSNDQLAAAMGKLTQLSIADPAVAAQAGRFIEETLPRLRVLPSGDDALMIFGDVRVFLQRSITGGYLLVLQPV